MVEDGLVLAMVMIMSEQEDFGRLCATVRAMSVHVYARARLEVEESRENWPTAVIAGTAAEH